MSAWMALSLVVRLPPSFRRWGEVSDVQLLVCLMIGVEGVLSVPVIMRALVLPLLVMWLLPRVETADVVTAVVVETPSWRWLSSQGGKAARMQKIKTTARWMGVAGGR